MESLRSYLNSLTPAEQEAFASRAGTSVGYLRKAISTGQRLGVELAIALDKESCGAVSVKQLRADVDWPYLCRSLAA